MRTHPPNHRDRVLRAYRVATTRTRLDAADHPEHGPQLARLFAPGLPRLSRDRNQARRLIVRSHDVMPLPVVFADVPFRSNPMTHDELRDELARAVRAKGGEADGE